MSTARLHAPRRLRRRSALALASCVVVLPVLVGCGVDENALETAMKKQGAAEVTTTLMPPDTRDEAGTSSEADGDAGEPLDDGFTEAVAATEAEDSFTFEATLSVDVAESPGVIEMWGSVERRPDGHRMSIGAGMEDQEQKVLVDGEDAWYWSDQAAFVDMLPSGAEWVHVTGSPDIEADVESAAGDMLGALNYLRGAEDIEDLGVATVDGEEVQTYSFTSVLDMDEGGPTLSGAAVGPGVVMEATGEVDVDTEGRVRRIEIHSEMSDDSGDVGSIDSEFHYSGFGEAVDVEAPSDDVTAEADGDSELTELAEAQIH